MTEPKSQKTALLLGAYGQSNLGDDLLMHNYLAFLEARGYENVYVNVARSDLVPAATLKEFPRAKLFEAYKTSPFALIGLIRRADCIVYGGGTVYKELYATTGRSPYPLLIRLAIFNTIAKVLKKPVYHLHIGIGSIKTARGRRLARRALKAASSSIFRDEQSYIYAKDVLGLPPQRIVSSTDGLFIQPKWQKIWSQLTLGARPKKDHKIVGINILSDIPDWIEREHYLHTMARFTDQLTAAGHQVVFLPFQTDFNPHNDLTFIKEQVLPRLRSPDKCFIAEDLAFDTIISCLKQIDVLVGMRFHSLLLATAAGTPFIGVTYDTKCWRFLEEHGYEHAMKLEDLSLTKLARVFEQVIAKGTPIRKQLARIAKRNFEAAAQWQRDFDF